MNKMVQMFGAGIAYSSAVLTLPANSSLFPVLACIDPNSPHDGNKTGLLPTCELQYNKIGCDAPAPSGFFDFSANSCHQMWHLPLPKDYIACGSSASYVGQGNGFTKFGFLSNYPPRDNVLNVEAVAQNATRFAGGQWVWASVTVRGYRKDLTLNKEARAKICNIDYSGGGHPFQPGGVCRCVSVPGQSEGVFMCGSSTFGVCGSGSFP